MKYLFILLLILFPMNLLAQNKTELTDLGGLTWQNRIILIWSDRQEYYNDILVANNDEILDRDIIWFIIHGSHSETNYKGGIADYFTTKVTKKYTPSTQEVLLIGKDGGIKNRSTELDLDALFRQIDSMPMRINEMREKSQKKKQ